MIQKNKEIAEQQMKTNEKNTNTKEKHQINQLKPMNKNKQRTAHEIYGEPKKNL